MFVRAYYTLLDLPINSLRLKSFVKVKNTDNSVNICACDNSLNSRRGWDSR